MGSNLVLSSGQRTRINGVITVIGAAVLAFYALPAPAVTVSFKATQAYSVSPGPTSVAVGDFNGDGKPDLVSADYGSNGVSMLLGNGDGTFQGAKLFSAGSGGLTFNIAVGDFNGDGKQDVAVIIPSANSLPGEVHVLLGNGDGTLQAPIVTTLSPQETIVAVADVNGDKKADLLANLFDANGPAGVEVLLGNGDGTFQKPKIAADGQQQGLFAAADLDHDGKADLVIGVAGTVQIMLGNGDGTFRGGSSSGLADGYYAEGALLADINGDGTPDVIVSSSRSVHCGLFKICFVQRTSVFLVTSRGDLQTEQIIGELPAGLIGDFDGDGKIDIAVRLTSTFPPATVFQIYPGNGDGTFAQPVLLSDPGPVFLAADLNGDQLADLVGEDPANNDIGVTLNSTPAFHISASQSTLTLRAGSEVTDEISLDTVNGFSSAIQLSCQVNGPAPIPTCTLSSPEVPAGSNSPTVTMTLTAPMQSKLVPTPRPRGMQPLYAMGFALAFVGFIPGTKRLGSRCHCRALAVLLGALLLATVACGGGSSGQRVLPQNQYSVQVTAKSDALTRTLQVSLTAS